MRMRKKKHGEERLLALSDLFFDSDCLDTIDFGEAYESKNDLRLEIIVTEIALIDRLEPPVMKQHNLITQIDRNIQ